MGEKLSTLIQEYKRGDNEKFLFILDKMEPLIKKYARLLYKDEKEDIYSDLVLYLLESLNKMEYYEDEGQCVYFLSQAIKNRFYELYKKSRRYFDNKVDVDEEYFDSLYSKQTEYEDILIKEDLSKLLLKVSGKQYQIFYTMIFNEETDAEIAKKFGISRQYVNRVRKKLIKLIKDEYFLVNK
ncbi:RNA polymerase sigma factor [Lacrimispora sp.]|uniref:RNA polymerase sigma factor n=1 Tax=Lacrimispora sp. TaxID=2719234 RepID=UPI0028AF7DE7|nr:sigma-70 family RNA polymerase sigma factor [Lacrimispora sp.]